MFSIPYTIQLKLNRISDIDLVNSIEILWGLFFSFFFFIKLHTYYTHRGEKRKRNAKRDESEPVVKPFSKWIMCGKKSSSGV